MMINFLETDVDWPWSLLEIDQCLYVLQTRNCLGEVKLNVDAGSLSGDDQGH